MSSPVEPSPPQQYPPEPWSLRGRLRVAVWLLPVRELPVLPPEVSGAARVVRLFGRGVVGAAWVEYEPGGVLTYQELLAAVLVRAGLRPRVTITHIWVDSVPSRDGGRALWGIPKDLAELEIADTRATALRAGGPLAAATLLAGPRLPFRWPVGFRVLQSLHSGPKTSRVRASGRIAYDRSQWTVPAGGPLGFLAGRRPMLTVALREFRMLFGSASAHTGDV
jgi:hypothetical protein